MSRAVAIVIVAAELLGDANEEYVNGTGRAGHRTARLVSLVFTRPDAFSHQAQRKLGLLPPENFFNSPADDLVIGEAIGLLCRTVEIGVNEAAIRRGETVSANPGMSKIARICARLAPSWRCRRAATRWSRWLTSRSRPSLAVSAAALASSAIRRRVLSIAMPCDRAGIRPLSVHRVRRRAARAGSDETHE
jgi:hypothetical protein